MRTQPVVGDVYARMRLIDNDPEMAIVSVLRALRLMPQRKQLAQVEYRRVEGYTQITRSTLYRHSDGSRLHAAWPEEWDEWQEKATLLNPEGELLTIDELIEATGSDELPTFNHEESQMQNENIATTVEEVAKNVMRSNHRSLSVIEKALMDQVKQEGAAFWCLLDGLGASREVALAKTKLEESVMWAVKHLTA